jgi:site-specific DNA-cytosine methylase
MLQRTNIPFVRRHQDSAMAMYRNSLLALIPAWVEAYRPKYAMLENVRSLVTHDRGEPFRLLLRYARLPDP